MTRHRFPHVSTLAASVAALFVLPACGSSGGEGGEPKGPGGSTLSCADNEIVENDECVIDPFRYEPDTRIDADNVLYYGTEEMQILTDLPDPPKSGFRLIMQPQDVPAGYDSEGGQVSGIEDVSPCQAWPMPDIENRWVYTAVVHTTPGLHHANMYGLEVDAEQGPQPYPNCRQSADSLVFGQISATLRGADPADLFVPTVLFANSTQVIGTSAEKYALDDGYAYELPLGIEIATNTHLQNTTPEALHVEAAWDFYTMPTDLVTNPAAMFVYIHFGFLIPPRAEKMIHGNCGWGGGDVLAIMPHTHQWATRFVTHFGNGPLRDYDQVPEAAFDTFVPELTPYDRQGTGLADSDIEVYHPFVPTEGMNGVQFQCHFNNTTDHDMTFGVGENEMCFLFGYTSPVEAQRVGIMVDEEASCLTLNPHDRGGAFNIVEWAATQPPHVQERLADQFGSSF